MVRKNYLVIDLLEHLCYHTLHVTFCELVGNPAADWFFTIHPQAPALAVTEP